MAGLQSTARRPPALRRWTGAPAIGREKDAKSGRARSDQAEPRRLGSKDLGENGVELVGKRRAPPSLDHSPNRDPREGKAVAGERHQRAHHKGGHNDAEHLEHAFIIVAATTSRNRTTTPMLPQIPLVIRRTTRVARGSRWH